MTAEIVVEPTPEAEFRSARLPFRWTCKPCEGRDDGVVYRGYCKNEVRATLEAEWHRNEEHGAPSPWKPTIGTLYLLPPSWAGGGHMGKVVSGPHETPDGEKWRVWIGDSTELLVAADELDEVV